MNIAALVTTFSTVTLGGITLTGKLPEKLAQASAPQEQESAVEYSVVATMEAGESPAAANPVVVAPKRDALPKGVQALPKGVYPLK